MPETVFVCPTPKCAYAIASEGLNKVQLQVLRRTRKTCPKCGNLQHFQEQATLPNIQTKTSTSYGGTQYEDLTQTARGTIPKTESQKRRSARNAGH